MENYRDSDVKSPKRIEYRELVQYPLPLLKVAYDILKQKSDLFDSHGRDETTATESNIKSNDQTINTRESFRSNR